LDSHRGRQVVRSLAEEVRARNLIGIMVTHDPEMAALASRTLALHDGELRPPPSAAAAVTGG
ncbi:MAG: hemin ABC transporter ATP-binding protein, partial [Dehalococcoidia bacterium]|nr:hemin ABC transporter ATP-binding protein [Dehalococcoidia bacterium]